MSKNKIHETPISQDLIDEALALHMEVLDGAHNMEEIDKELLNHVFPNGYECISLPIDRIALKCKNCTARTLFIFLTYKDKTSPNTLIFCRCINCGNDYAIFIKDNTRYYIEMNYDI